MKKIIMIKLYLLSILLCAMLASSLSTSVNAEITRGCEGYLIIKEVGNPKDKDLVLLDKFEGRGACANTIKANDCRRRAKDNILRCGNELWNDRWSLIGNPNDNLADHALPQICRSEHTGVRKLGFKINQHGKATDIKYAIDYAACCQLNSTDRVLHVNPIVVSDGDSGCTDNNRRPVSRVLWDDYEVNCGRLRNQGICGVPSGRTRSGRKKR